MADNRGNRIQGTDLRRKHYDEMCQLADENGKPVEEAGWYYIVNERKNVRLLPVDLNHFNSEVAEVMGLNPPVDPNYTLVLLGEQVTNRKKTDVKQGSGVTSQTALSKLISSIKAKREGRQPDSDKEESGTLETSEKKSLMDRLKELQEQKKAQLKEQQEEEQEEDEESEEDDEEDEDLDDEEDVNSQQEDDEKSTEKEYTGKVVDPETLDVVKPHTQHRQHNQKKDEE